MKVLVSWNVTYILQWVTKRKSNLFMIQWHAIIQLCLFVKIISFILLITFKIITLFAICFLFILLFVRKLQIQLTFELRCITKSTSILLVYFDWVQFAQNWLNCTDNFQGNGNLQSRHNMAKTYFNFEHRPNNSFTQC